MEADQTNPLITNKDDDNPYSKVPQYAAQQPAAPKPEQRQVPPTSPATHAKHYGLAIVIVVVLAAIASVVYLAAISNLNLAGLVSGNSGTAFSAVSRDYQAGNYSGAVSVISKQESAQPSLNAKYSGVSSFSATVLGVSVSSKENFTVDYLKSGANSSLLIKHSETNSNSSSSGIGSITNDLTGLTGLFITIENKSYECNGSGLNCTPGSKFNIEQEIKNLTSNNNSINVTDSKISYSSYNGNPCVLVSGKYLITLRNSSASLAGSEDSIKGNFSSCLSEKYYLPLTLRIIATNISETSGGTTASLGIYALLEANETSITTNASNSEILSLFKSQNKCIPGQSLFGLFNTPYTCSNVTVGPNNTLKFNIVYTPSLLGKGAGLISTKMPSPQVLCVTYLANFNEPEYPPQASFTQPAEMTVNSSGVMKTTASLQCYNQNGSIASIPPNGIFVGVLYSNITDSDVGVPGLAEMGTVQLKT